MADTAQVERRLRERQAELGARLAGLKRTPERGSGISFGKRVGDGTVEAVSRLNDVAVVDSLNASQERVERALAKLAEGTYGTCDVCGGQIPAPRLEAQPESAVCVSCARLARRNPQGAVAATRLPRGQVSRVTRQPGAEPEGSG
jgi:DnaK suppressor protein